MFWTFLLSITLLTSAPNTSHANMSVMVTKLSTGEVIEKYREAHVVPPASVMKLLTTGCALETLGADYRFVTTLSYTGTISDGVLRGHLYIYGEGDPSLGDPKLKQGNFLTSWVQKIKEAGIRRIEGSIIADMSAFDGDATNPAWIWEDCGNYYAPGIFGLNYMGNTLNITLQSGPIGSVATVLNTIPEIEGLTFINRIRCTQTTCDGAFVHGLPYSSERYLCGSVPSNQGTFGVKSDIPNPGLLLAKQLEKALERAGVVCVGYPGLGKTSYLAEPTAQLLPKTIITEHLSLPLSELIKESNIHSNNLYAEAIFRHLGLQYGRPGTINNSCRFVQDFWKRRGVAISPALIKDGCGLAPQDAISAETLIQLLTAMHKSPNWETWYATLPISGVSGTLTGLGAGTSIQGRVHAKSGTISGTKNYAGYIEGPDGELYAFAVLINSAQGKARGVQRVIQKWLIDLYRTL